MDESSAETIQSEDTSEQDKSRVLNIVDIESYQEKEEQRDSSFDNRESFQQDLPAEISLKVQLNGIEGKNTAESRN